MNRWKDWWDQALRDLDHVKSARQSRHFEWAAFAAHQAAEKAIKALIFQLGGEPWGHSVAGLLESLPSDRRPEPEVEEAASRLDKHYLPARYPNGLPEGFPAERYTESEAQEATAHAQTVLDFCRRHLS